MYLSIKLIKASKIITLLEEWVGVGDHKVEILENPLNWRSAASYFRKDLVKLRKELELRYGTLAKSEDSQLLRFIYDRKTDDIQVWIAYQAIHGDLVSSVELKNTFYGAFNVYTKAALVVNPRAMQYIVDVRKLPKKLAAFVSGLDCDKLLREAI